MSDWEISRQQGGKLSLVVFFKEPFQAIFLLRFIEEFFSDLGLWKYKLNSSFNNISCNKF